jgi:hypothetical protein
LKYSRELRIAAMPCRHSKYDADMERERAAIILDKNGTMKRRGRVYRGDQDRETHVACHGAEEAGHLLKITAGVVLGRHRSCVAQARRRGRIKSLIVSLSAAW